MVFTGVSSTPLLLIGGLSGGGVRFSDFSVLITEHGGVLGVGGPVLLCGRTLLLD